jgi:aspartate kinase
MSSANVCVEKIGGTSMTRFAECLENIILRDSGDVYDRVMTVSAYGGVTNALL